MVRQTKALAPPHMLQDPGHHWARKLHVNKQLNIKYLQGIFSRKFINAFGGVGAEEHNVTKLCIPGPWRQAGDIIGILFFLQQTCM